MRAAALLCCAGLLSACYQVDLVAERAACAELGCAQDAGPLPDAGAGGFCEGGGPVVSVGDGRCGGDLAQRAFRFAVCSCESLVSSAGITADSFDSRIAPYSTGGAGASVGINGRLDLNASGQINGGLWVSDPSGMVAGQAGSLDVSRSLSCAGPVQSQAAVNVGQDAYINGNLRAQSLNVGGRLTMPEGAALDVTDTARWGERSTAAVQVPPPCDCASHALLDIGALVRARADDNDNAIMGLSQDDLRGASGQWSFECGRYYFRGVQSDSGLDLHINGRVALFVEGDVSVNGRLTITLGPQAELDLFISGQLNTGEPPQIGSVSRPAQARTYVGGQGTVQLTGGGQFAGSLYAPRSELVSSGPIEVFGALFARRIVSSGRLTLHYDRALQAAADDCPPRTDLACTTCADCRSGACLDGQCQACVRDSDCCTPLTCQQGACLIEP